MLLQKAWVKVECLTAEYFFMKAFFRYQKEKSPLWIVVLHLCVDSVITDTYTALCIFMYSLQRQIFAKLCLH